MAEKGEEGLSTANPVLRIQSYARQQKSRKRFSISERPITWGNFGFLGIWNVTKISSSGVYCVLVRHGLNRLPQNAKKRQMVTKRYEKQAPGRHIQVDVKFLNLKTSSGKNVRRFQYAAVDDATRIRALKI